MDATGAAASPRRCCSQAWKTINAQFAGVPEDEKHAILAGNALRVYPRFQQ